MNRWIGQIDREDIIEIPAQDLSVGPSAVSGNPIAGLSQVKVEFSSGPQRPRLVAIDETPIDFTKEVTPRIVVGLRDLPAA